jgi:hypothetical protein
MGHFKVPWTLHRRASVGGSDARMIMGSDETALGCAICLGSPTPYILLISHASPR